MGRRFLLLIGIIGSKAELTEAIVGAIIVALNPIVIPLRNFRRVNLAILGIYIIIIFYYSVISGSREFHNITSNDS
jgi:hypothetical protein